MPLTGADGDVASPAGASHAAMQALLATPGVRDAAVAERITAAGERILVGYVVADDPWHVHRPDAAIAGPGPLPELIIRVPCLPLTEVGTVDYTRLAATALIDDALRRRAESLVREFPAVQDVLVTDAAATAPVLHLADLIPGWQSRTQVEGEATRRSTDAHRAAASAVPSVVHGAPLEVTAAAPRVLPDLLRDAASRGALLGMTYIESTGEIDQTWPALCLAAERVLGGLRAAGLEPGDYVVLQLPRGQDFLTVFWGCVLGGFVPAPLSVPATFEPTGGGAARLRNVLALLRRAVVVTSESLAPSIRALDERVFTVEALATHEPGATWHTSRPTDVAMLLLTSGSTGVPKAVTQTHEALLARSAAMATACGFTGKDVALHWLPLDHVGGIVMFHVAFLYLRSRQVQAETDFVLQDPLRWLDLIDRFRATYTWAPNFAFGLVNDRASEIAGRHWDLSCMRFAMNAGEAVVARTARRFLRLLAPHGLPGTAMRPVWGMSETCSGVMVSDDFVLESTTDDDRFVEVGRLIPGVSARLVNEHEVPVAEGSIGRLQVRGRCVTRGYLNNPEATADALTGDGWLRTGDLARVVEGRFTITGREKGVIIINGANYHAHEIEAVVEEIRGVVPSCVAAFPVRERGGQTDALAVAVHAEVQGNDAVAALLRQVRAVVREQIGVHVSYLLPVERDEIPKTGIGKIQHAALTRRFEEGGFDEGVRRFDRLLETGDTLPSWFYRPLWRRRDAERDHPPGPDSSLVLLSPPSALMRALEDRARADGVHCATVDPAALGHLARVVGALPAGRGAVIVLRDPSSPDSDTVASGLANAASLLQLVQALAVAPGAESRTIRLLVAEGGVHHVEPGDVAGPAQSLSLGILRTVPQEHPRIACRHVDLGAGEPVLLARTLFAELEDLRDEPEVAYRGGRRWVRRIERHAPTPDASSPPFGPITGFYLVTGGLGGIGGEIARRILSAWHVPVLLLGRRALEADGERRALFASLQSLGDVHYDAVDVADPAALAASVNAATRRWARPLGGVLHFAGEFAHRPLAAETPESLATTCRGKVEGAWALHRLLHDHPGAVFIVSSSINGYFGGHGAGAYAAANAYLDALVRHRNTELGRPSYSLAWSLWDDVGMSRGMGLRDPAWRRGYYAIALPKGLASLQAVLAAEPGHVLIGLDGANAHVQRHATDAVAPASLTAYCTIGQGQAPPVTLPLVDHFGTPVSLGIEAVPDLASIRARAGARTDSALADAPGWEATGLERMVAGIWRELLASDRIGPDDNFFDLGGSSLLIATASRRLRDTLKRDVPLTAIYRYPTLRQLAAHLAEADAVEAPELRESGTRGGSRRQKVLERKRRRE